MIKSRILTADEIITLIEHCSENETEYYIPFCEICPLIGECLYYFTGDDSELKGETNESK